MTEFGKILIFIITGVLFVLFGYVLNYFLRKDKPNDLKNTPYECGEVAIGEARLPFNMRFYIMAMVFLLFEVEIVFIFPWALVFAKKEIIEQIPNWGWFSLTEMIVFIGILLLGLAYIWRMGDINWAPKPLKLEGIRAKVPLYFYEKLNIQKYPIREFRLKENLEADQNKSTTLDPKINITRVSEGFQSKPE